MTANKALSIRRWTAATFWGWLLGVVLILLLSSGLEAMGIGHLQFYTGLSMGAGVGFSQWLLLRKYRLVSGGLWFLASLAGMGIPFLILDLFHWSNAVLKLPLGVACGGLLVGLLQFSLWKTRNAWLWILACWVAWVLAALSVVLINYTMTIKVTAGLNLVLALLNLVLILSGGIVLGLISGYALKRLDRIPGKP